MTPFEVERLIGACWASALRRLARRQLLGPHVQQQLQHRVFAHRHDHAHLEDALGTPGDGKRRSSCITSAGSSATPTLADLREALAEGTGKPELVNAIFASQVYGTDKVDASVVSIDSEEQVPRAGTELRDGKRITLTDKEVDKQIDDARAAWKKAHKDAEFGGPYPWLSTITVRRTGGRLAAHRAGQVCR